MLEGGVAPDSPHFSVIRREQLASAPERGHSRLAAPALPPSLCAPRLPWDSQKEVGRRHFREEQEPPSLLMLTPVQALTRGLQCLLECESRLTCALLSS